MKFIWQDFLIGGAVLANMGAYIATVYITTSVSALTGTALGTGIEANPVQAAILGSAYLAFILRIIIYSLSTGAYLMFRRRRDLGELHAFSFDILTLFVFFFWFYDCFNDIAILLHFI